MWNPTTQQRYGFVKVLMRSSLEISTFVVFALGPWGEGGIYHWNLVLRYSSSSVCLQCQVTSELRVWRNVAVVMSRYEPMHMWVSEHRLLTSSSWFSIIVPETALRRKHLQCQQKENCYMYIKKKITLYPQLWGAKPALVVTTLVVRT